MAGEIAGKWILKDIKGVDDFCKDFASQIQQEEHHTIEFKKDGDKWVQTSLFGNNFLQALWLMDYGPQEFEEGKEFTHKDLSGSDSKSTITIEGNKLKHTQVVGQGSENLMNLMIEREFQGDKMTTTFGYVGDSAARTRGIVAEFERVK